MNSAGGPAGGYTPAQLAKAYGVNAGGSTSITVGIVDAFDDPTAKADLNHFDAQYGLPAETSSSFKKVSQTGSTTSLPTVDTGWAGEITLDLDAVRGLCHKCKIVLVEANSSSFSDLSTAVNQAVAQGAKVISNSYGGAESGPSSTLEARYNHKGVVITASTGDDGYFGWDHQNDAGTSPGVANIPSTLNTVVAVGGTSLQLNDNGTRSSEAVWNENGHLDVTGNNLSAAMGATGGGCSTLYNAQSWQANVANYANTGCGSKRLAADISALADPYTGYDIYGTTGLTGWATFGGTSLSSPLIAAMFALAGGAHGVDYPSQTIYKNFKSTPKDFYDVTEGGNGFCGGSSPASCKAIFTGNVGPNNFFGVQVDCGFKGTTSTLTNKTRACDAATGYDGPTGVGTPKGVAGLKP
jgi:subtilase family serine protease